VADLLAVFERALPLDLAVRVPPRPRAGLDLLESSGFARHTWQPSMRFAASPTQLPPIVAHCCAAGVVSMPFS
jgi:hypothetical protein